MNPETQNLRVEIELLRGSLFLARNALRDYCDSKHVKTEDGRLQLVVPESLPVRAADALERADRMLKDQGRGR